MKSTKIKVACVMLFALSGAVNAQTTADSNSGSSSNSSAASGTSSISGSGNSTNSSTSSLRNSGNSSASSSLKGSGNSNVSVSVTLASATDPSGSNGTATSNAQNPSAVAKDAVGSPGSSAFNTQTQENVNYSGSQTIKTNPAIQAPGLTTTLSDTCMGSVSFGFSAPGFGATAGSTLVDQACVRRLDAREFRAMGLTDVALALLCQSDANRRAVESTGHLCPGTTAPLAKATGEASPSAMVSDDLKYSDPIVRQRMGLPALDHNASVQQAVQAQAQPVATPAPAPVAVPVQLAPPASVQAFELKPTAQTANKQVPLTNQAAQTPAPAPVEQAAAPAVPVPATVAAEPVKAAEEPVKTVEAPAKDVQADAPKPAAQPEAQPAASTPAAETPAVTQQEAPAQATPKAEEPVVSQATQAQPETEDVVTAPVIDETVAAKVTALK